MPQLAIRWINGGQIVAGPGDTRWSDPMPMLVMCCFTTSLGSWLQLPRLPLMVDAFIADTRLDPFKGTHSTFPPDRHPDPMPNRWLPLYSDGSVKMDHYSQKLAPSKGYEGFGWAEVFDDSCVQGGMTEHQCTIGGNGP